MPAKSSLLRNLFSSKSRKNQKRGRQNRRMFVEGLENRIVLDHQGLAVAFIDVDGDDQFTTNDKMIAEAIDTDDSGDWNTGDEVRFGVLPTGTGDATTSTAPTVHSTTTSDWGQMMEWGPQQFRAFGVVSNLHGSTGITFVNYFDASGNKTGEAFMYPNSGIIDRWDGNHIDQVANNPAAGANRPFGDIPLFSTQGADTGFLDGDFFDVIIGGHVPGGASANEDPELTVGNVTVTVDEGELAENSGTVSDPDGDTVSLNTSAGAVTNNNDGTWSWSLATDDGPADGSSIAIDGDDGNGGADDVSFTLVVNNLAPDADLSGPSSALIGESVTFTLGADDASSADRAAGFDFDIDWDGDGDVDQTVSGLDGTAVNHTFAAGGSTTVIVTATDKDDGTSEEASFEINVIQPVDVDLKPGNAQNKVNAKSQGLVTVALYTTNDFDAADVIGSSVQLAGVGVDHFALEDVDNDGDLDLVLHFAVQDLLDALALDLDSGDEESVDVSLTGSTNSGVDVLGSDTINFFFPGKGKGKK